MHLGVVTTSYPSGPQDPSGCFVYEHNCYLQSLGHTVEVVAGGTGHEDDSWQGHPVERIVDSSLSLFGFCFYPYLVPMGFDLAGSAYAQFGCPCNPC